MARELVKWEWEPKTRPFLLFKMESSLGKKARLVFPFLEVDTSTLNQGLGLQSGEYQVGYTLRLDKPN